MFSAQPIKADQSMPLQLYFIHNIIDIKGIDRDIFSSTYYQSWSNFIWFTNTIDIKGIDRDVFNLSYQSWTKHAISTLFHSQIQ